MSFTISVLIATASIYVWAESALPAESRSQQRSGILRVELELCGGPSGSARQCRLFTGKWTGCVDHVCSSLDQIDLRTRSGSKVAEVEVRRGRFVVRLKPGTYVVSLLWTSKHHRPKLALKRRIAIRTDQTTRVVFKGYAG